MVTVLGITVFLQPNISLLPNVWIIALQLSRESYFGLSLAIVILDSLLQLLNASLPMEVTDLPMITLVRPLHHLKALEPIEVTEFPVTTPFRPLQLENADAPMAVTA